MSNKNDRRRVEMSELRKLFTIGRLLAAKAQQSGDEMLKELGHIFDQELDCMRDAAFRNTPTNESKENHHAG